MSSGWGIKISGPDGRQQSIQAWADELGMDHQTLRDRIARGMRPEEVLSPVRRRGAKKPRSAALPIAARAQELLENAKADTDTPWEALWMCVAARAVLDWFDDDYRAEVESFFRGRWFASMSGNCGEEIIRTLRKEEARGRQKTVYAVGGHYRAV